MNKIFKWKCLFALEVFALSFLSVGAQEPPAEYFVSPTAIFDKPERIGINLGAWTTYGTQQFSSNILMNPGIEGDVDRVFVFVDSTSWNTFFDQAGWGYDNGYWNGATYRVMSGASMGATGRIMNSYYAAGINNLPAYVTSSALPPLSPFDAIVISKETNTNPTPIWWIPNPSVISVDPTQYRPGSPGIQSLQMTPSSVVPAEINFYLDAESDHADKFLILSGAWKFSIWAKSDAENANLSIMFRRINGTDPFLLQSFPLTTEWKEYTLNFSSEDTGYAQTLQLMIQATGSGGSTWIDDVFLGPVQDNPSFPFRKEVVSMLKELHPSYIRDTQGQLGDTFANRVAKLFGRRAVSSRFYAAPRSLSTCYSIGDLLTLCKAVDANPWIVVPPVFSPEEAFALGQYLGKCATARDFEKVIVEFGNENWNFQFRSTGIPYADIHGVVAEQSFQQIVAGAGRSVNLIKIVNGQYVNPSATMDFLNSTPSADGVAVGPYFFPELGSATSEFDNLTELFSLDSYMEETAELVRNANKRLSVYETNLTTVDGDASASERDGYTVGAGSGAALAQRLLKNIALKVQPQCIYCFNQYDIYSFSAGDYVKLWGITRDLNPTLRMRPQGLAMKLLNKVIDGDVYNVSPVGEESLDNLTILAFRTKDRWNIAAVNPNPDPVTVNISFPNDGYGMPFNQFTLNYLTSPLDTNEDAENVNIATATVLISARTATITLPAWGLSVARGGLPLPLDPTCCRDCKTISEARSANEIE